jgi:hypothetical protein
MYSPVLAFLRRALPLATQLKTRIEAYNFYRPKSARYQPTVFIIFPNLPEYYLIKYLVKVSASELNGSFGDAISIY